MHSVGFCTSQNQQAFLGNCPRVKIMQIVSNISEVISVMDSMPETEIDNLIDPVDGSKLPIQGVFFKTKEIARKYGSDSRLVVSHSKGEDYHFQTLQDATDQAIAAYKTLRCMGSDCVEMSAHFHNGYHISFTQKIEYSQRRFMFENDIVIPWFNLSIPYNACFTGNGGGKRIVCSNLFTTKHVAKFHFSLRHTKNMGERLIGVEKGIQAIAGNWDAFIEHCNTLARKSVSLDAFYEHVYGEKPDTKRGITVWNDRKAEIRARIDSEANKLGLSPNNAWLVFNGLQGYLQHDTTRKAEHDLILASQANNSPALARGENYLLSV